jgi:hypothetical protein
VRKWGGETEKASMGLTRVNDMSSLHRVISVKYLGHKQFKWPK